MGTHWKLPVGCSVSISTLSSKTITVSIKVGWKGQGLPILFTLQGAEIFMHGSEQVTGLENLRG